MTDGTFVEFELEKEKLKQQKWKTKYNVTKTTLPIFTALGEDVKIKEIFVC